ncbi:hypothetical protein SADUNF_Sadunf12G0008100 [Salix dunnii]|uniref:Uncharacterized protein n=1 Tax=Salix dunnii TaxID=1413687 RepID=A0A835JKF0_9ROSI|nr:hypothetical protein SADUNF_Sadunf12G0008100 [Salix dunnii]
MCDIRSCLDSRPGMPIAILFLNYKMLRFHKKIEIVSPFKQAVPCMENVWNKRHTCMETDSFTWNSISSSFSSNYSSSTHHQALSVLQFKQSFSIDSYASSEDCQYPSTNHGNRVQTVACEMGSLVTRKPALALVDRATDSEGHNRIHHTRPDPFELIVKTFRSLGTVVEDNPCVKDPFDVIVKKGQLRSCAVYQEKISGDD